MPFLITVYQTLVRTVHRPGGQGWAPLYSVPGKVLSSLRKPVYLCSPATTVENTLQKPPTIHDVAEALGLHKSTVSLARSGKGTVSAATRARVLSAARELGYHPNPLAQHLARGYRDDLVCLFTGVLDVGLTTQKILAIQQALSARELNVPIYIEGDRPGAGGS